MSQKRAAILYVFGWLDGKKVLSHWKQAKGLYPVSIQLWKCEYGITRTSQRIPWKNTWRNTRITGPDFHHSTIAIQALPRPLVGHLSIFLPPFSLTLRLTVLYIMSPFGHMWENIPTYLYQVSLQQSQTF